MLLELARGKSCGADGENLRVEDASAGDTYTSVAGSTAAFTDNVKCHAITIFYHATQESFSRYWARSARVGAATIAGRKFSAGVPGAAVGHAV